MTKRKKAILATILIIIIFAAFIIIVLLSSGTLEKADTETARIQYIEKLGYTVKSVPPDVKNIIIPSEFSDVYKSYNELQLKSGFDLMKYRGEIAATYSYYLLNYKDESGELRTDVRLTLIIWNGYIIGGDIASTRLDGFMLPLVNQQTL